MSEYNLKPITFSPSDAAKLSKEKRKKVLDKVRKKWKEYWKKKYEK